MEFEMMETGLSFCSLGEVEWIVDEVAGRFFFLFEERVLEVEGLGCSAYLRGGIFFEIFLSALFWGGGGVLRFCYWCLSC